MMYYWAPPLENMAAVKFALAMYYDIDIKEILESKAYQLFPEYDDFRKDHYYQKRKLFKLIEKEAVKKLSDLPDLLTTKISKLIRAIHMQVEVWIEDHHTLLNLTQSECYLAFKNRLSWCSNGTIDRVQVAKTIIQDRGIDLRRRFAIACTYFLENEVLSLWHGDENRILTNKRYGQTNVSVRFWINHLKTGAWNKKSWKEVIPEYFQQTRFNRNDKKVRVSCFFPFLLREQKMTCFSIFGSNHRVHYDDFLVCSMSIDEKDREEVYSEYPSATLYAYLEWPFQSFALEIAEKLKTKMTKNMCHAVLRFILKFYIGGGLEFFDYLGFVRDLWHLIPDPVKDELNKDKSLKAVGVAMNYDPKRNRFPLPEILEKLKF